MNTNTAALALAFATLAPTQVVRAAPPEGKPGPTEAVGSLIAKLEKSISLSSKPDPNVVSAVARAKSELEAGRVLAALYRLQSPSCDLAMRSYLSSKSSIQALGPFEAEWKTAGKEIARQDAGLSEIGIAALPAAVRALVETNRAESRVFYKSARLYGRETEARNGLAYVGLAKGKLTFAVWASTLDFPPAGRTGTRSPRSQIRELESRVLQAYDRPGKSTPPGSFENINSTLKTAGELDRDGKFDGAVQQLLDAEFFFDLVSSEESPAGNPDALRKASAEALAKIESSSTDPSIGRMIWELAQGNLAPERDGTVASDRLARASIELERVLPRYFRLRESASSETAAAPAPARVRITLVRWPYT